MCQSDLHVTGRVAAGGQWGHGAGVGQAVGLLYRVRRCGFLALGLPKKGKHTVASDLDLQVAAAPAQVQALLHSQPGLLNKYPGYGIYSIPHVSFIDDIDIFKGDIVPAGRYLLPLHVLLVPGKIDGYGVTGS